MDYTDILQLAAYYLGFLAGVFGLAYAPGALWRWFKTLAESDYRGD